MLLIYLLFGDSLIVSNVGHVRRCLVTSFLAGVAVCLCVCVCPFVKVCHEWIQPQECPAYFASQKLYTEYPYAQCMEYLPTFTQQMAQFCR